MRVRWVFQGRLTNSPWGPGFTAFWTHEFGFVFDAADFRMPVLQWVNDGLLSVFFLTAAAIVDDIGAIIVVALFYSNDLHAGYLVAALAITILLALLNRWNIYRAAPYVVTALALWACIHASGLHATLAAVILAFFIPTRPPANFRALTTQADAIIRHETQNSAEGLGRRLSTPALNALDAIHNRLQSPAGRVLRHIEPWSTYVVLPVFALANSGLVITSGIWGEHGRLMAAIMLGLIVGKPIGMVLASALAVRLGVATKPDAYSWSQVAGAGALAGIGFTMSLFIASEAFPEASNFAAAKIAIFTASIIAAVFGLAILWKAGSAQEAN